LAILPKPQQVGSTQDHLKITEIRESLVVTKKGELRAILMASPVNFALKSEQEQNAIVYAYQNFLNSLNFPIQILVRSKKLDLFKYLNKLKDTNKTQTNELLRVQAIDYIDFIERLIKIANIMDKQFYVVIPYLPPPKMQSPQEGIQNLQKGFKKGAPAPSGPQMTAEEFKSYKEELGQRIQVIQSGLGSVGIRSAPLNTQQIIELFYEIYNPEEANKEKLTDVENLTAPLIESELEKKEDNEPAQPVTK